MSDQEIKLRSLRPSDFSQMYRTFIDAFSNYMVKMDLSKEAFRVRIEDKLNINYPLSVGAFHGEKLIGFIFNTLNEYEGFQTAYNGGTGVLKGYWGSGITKSMYDFIILKLRENNVERCLLEVITTNDKAISAYSKSGFVRTKHFKCFKLKQQIQRFSGLSGVEFKSVIPDELTKYKEISDFNPSMLDSLEQLPFNLQNESIIEASIDNQLVGYVIFQVKSYRISLMGVESSFRRMGIGTKLLWQVQHECGGQPLTILNIDIREKGTIEFLESIGFMNELDQYEMELRL